MISTLLPPPPRWLPVRVALGGMLAALVIALSGGAGLVSGWTGLGDPALLARGARSAAVLAIALMMASTVGFTLSWLMRGCGKACAHVVALPGRCAALFPVAALTWSAVAWWIGALGRPVETLMPFQLPAGAQDWRMLLGADLWEYLAPALVLAVPLTGEVVAGTSLPLRARLQSLCLHGPAWLILIEDVLHFMGWGGWMAQALRTGDAAAAASGLAVMGWTCAMFCTLLNALPPERPCGRGITTSLCWQPWPLWVLAACVCVESQQMLWLLMWLILALLGFPQCLDRLRGRVPAVQMRCAGSWSLETLSQLLVWLAAIAALHPNPLSGGVMRLFRPLLVTTQEQAARTLAAPRPILHTGLLLLGVALGLHLAAVFLRAGIAQKQVHQDVTPEPGPE
jgi:hypothetical protein